jgi:hypothetical protein
VHHPEFGQRQVDAPAVPEREQALFVERKLAARDQPVADLERFTLMDDVVQEQVA